MTAKELWKETHPIDLGIVTKEDAIEFAEQYAAMKNITVLLPHDEHIVIGVNSYKKDVKEMGGIATKEILYAFATGAGWMRSEIKKNSDEIQVKKKECNHPKGGEMKYCITVGCNYCSHFR